MSEPIPGTVELLNDVLPPLPIPSFDTADYMTLLVESQMRKDALAKLHRTVEEWQERYVAAEREWHAQFDRAQAEAVKHHTNNRKLTTMFSVTARAVCPILREYLLFVGQLPLASGTPAFEQNQRNAREMLTLLERYEKQ